MEDCSAVGLAVLGDVVALVRAGDVVSGQGCANGADGCVDDFFSVSFLLFLLCYALMFLQKYKENETLRKSIAGYGCQNGKTWVTI